MKYFLNMADEVVSLSVPVSPLGDKVRFSGSFQKRINQRRDDRENNGEKQITEVNGGRKQDQPDRRKNDDQQFLLHESYLRGYYSRS